MRYVIEKAFSNIGFEVIHFNDKPNANGVDCWVKKQTGKPLSVEIKRVRINKSSHGQLQVEPVSKPRLSDDLIAIIFNDNYVLIEPMEEVPVWTSH